MSFPLARRNQAAVDYPCGLLYTGILRKRGREDQYGKQAQEKHTSGEAPINIEDLDLTAVGDRPYSIVPGKRKADNVRKGAWLTLREDGGRLGAGPRSCIVGDEQI